MTSATLTGLNGLNPKSNLRSNRNVGTTKTSNTLYRSYIDILEYTPNRYSKCSTLLMLALFLLMLILIVTITIMTYNLYVGT